VVCLNSFLSYTLTHKKPSVQIEAKIGPAAILVLKSHKQDGLKPSTPSRSAFVVVEMDMFPVYDTAERSTFAEGYHTVFCEKV